MRIRVVVFLISLALQAVAQRSTGTIAGSVQDQSGSPVPDASVTVRNTATGVERETRSNQDGFYTITALPAGPYSVVGEARRFSDLLDPFGGAAGGSAGHGQCGPSGRSSDGECDDHRHCRPVDTRGATLNTVITEKMMNDLPLNGRNVMQLLRLTPGTLSAPGTFNQAATRPETAEN